MSSSHVDASAAAAPFAASTAPAESDTRVLSLVARSSASTVTAVTCSVFLCMLPVTMLVPVLRELLVERFHASTFATHVFMSVNMVGGLLIAPVGAWLADRAGRRRTVLLVALLCDGALLALMGWLSAHAPTLKVLMPVRFLEGGAHLVAISTLMAMAQDLARDGQRGRIMGVIGAALIFGTAFGTPLGGRIGQVSPISVFGLGAALCGVGALIAAIWLNDEAGSTPRGATLRNTVSLLRHCPALRVPCLFGFIDRFCVGVIVTSFILFLGEVHHAGPADKGQLMALFLFPFALLCYPMGRVADRLGRVWLMCLGNGLFGVIYAFYGVTPLNWLPVAMAASGVLSALMFAPNLAICSDLAPREQRTAAFAAFNMAGSLGFMTGPILGGTLMTCLSPTVGAPMAYRVTFVVTGLAVVACAAGAIPALLRMRRAGLTR